MPRFFGRRVTVHRWHALMITLTPSRLSHLHDAGHLLCEPLPMNAPEEQMHELGPGGANQRAPVFSICG